MSALEGMPYGILNGSELWRICVATENCIGGGITNNPHWGRHDLYEALFSESLGNLLCCGKG